MTDAGVLGCGRALGAERTAVEEGHHSLDSHTHEEAEVARRTDVDTAVGWNSPGSSPGSSPGNDQDGPVMIRHEAERGMRHSLRSRSHLELVVNSAKEELENWTYSWRMDYHHGLPESSNLES